MSQQTNIQLQPFAVSQPGSTSVAKDAVVSVEPEAGASVPDDGDVVSGQSLSWFLQQRLPSSDWGLHLFEQMCESFKTFHLGGSFHLQLETSKIQLVEVPKLKEMPEATGKKDKKDEVPQVVSVLPEDVRYVAPEVLRGEVADVRADVYSLAAIFYEILTGLPAQPSCHFPPNYGRFKDYEWVGMQKVLQQAMSQRPEDRPETVEDFWDAIVEARRDPSQPPPSKMAQYTGKIQKDMGDHVRKFVNGEAKVKVATWINGGKGGGMGVGVGSPLVDEVVIFMVKEVFGGLMKAGSGRVNGAIDKKIAAAKTKQASWFSRLLQGMKKSVLYVGLAIGMVTAGGVKLVSMMRKPAVVAQQSTMIKKKPKKKLPLTLRMWRGVRGWFSGKKAATGSQGRTKAPSRTRAVLPVSKRVVPKR